jgi:NodT family efflux transporter outer membrane factor (OMF) lipoprotein
MGLARRLGSVLLAAALAGCVLRSPPEPKEVQSEALPNLGLPQAWSERGAAPGAVADDWLASFGDPQLDALVREALAYNPDLRVAAARVERAAAFVTSAGATLYPQVNLLARGGGRSGGDSSGLQGAAVFAEWELDLWGRVRSGREAAHWQYVSAALETYYARQSLAALVARSWFVATEARLQKSQAEDMVRAAEQLTQFTRDRLQVGRASEYDVAVAEASLQTYLDSLQQLDLAYRQAVRALETLAGRYPSASLEAAAALRAPPGAIPAGMPAELLERRPDVVAAERRVAAAFHRVEEAKAARLPRISLTAGVASVSSDLIELKDFDNPFATLGASLLQPIFLGGQLQAQIDIRTAEQKQAIAEYGRVGARAFADVESALSASFTADAREPILARAVAERQRTVEFALVRYRVGSGDLRDVAQEQLALYSARIALLRVQAERLVQRVNLHLALGGSFEPVQR